MHFRTFLRCVKDTLKQRIICKRRAEILSNHSLRFARGKVHTQTSRAGISFSGAAVSHAYICTRVYQKYVIYNIAHSALCDDVFCAPGESRELLDIYAERLRSHTREAPFLPTACGLSCNHIFTHRTHIYRERSVRRRGCAP
jgi:hypothetical protein